MSRSVLVNERDGLRHDYTRTHEHERLVRDFGITAPELTPERFLDRSTLWNEVERYEKGAEARLCRKIMIPLPDELTLEQQTELAQKLVDARVAEGHVVDACLHINLPDKDHPGEYNAHLHMLEPLREIGPEGFQLKSECTYLVRDASLSRDEYMSARELKETLERGEKWEKVYVYKEAGRRLELTKEQAQERGLDPIKDRVRKQSVQQARNLQPEWNDRGRVEDWRRGWAETINRSLEEAGLEVRVDHRSYERQGIDRIPMQHEGYMVQAIERRAEREAREQGRAYEPVTELRRQNVETKERNARIEQLKGLAARIDREYERVRDQVLEETRRLALEARRKLERGAELAQERMREALRRAELAIERKAGQARESDLARKIERGAELAQERIKGLFRSEERKAERIREESPERARERSLGDEAALGAALAQRQLASSLGENKRGIDREMVRTLEEQRERRTEREISERHRQQELSLERERAEERSLSREPSLAGWGRGYNGSLGGRESSMGWER